MTRLTDPFKPEHVAEVLRLVKISPDLSDAERAEVVELISRFTNCFALSVGEVALISGANHYINIPPDAVFSKKFPQQKPLMDNQCTYLNNAIDKLIAADIIETICPEVIKCCLPITLALKVHHKPSLSLNGLQHRVNEECIIHGMAPVHNIEANGSTHPTPELPPPDSIHIKHGLVKPQTWRICQNYSALNRVTQVFPTPGGDIHTKQHRLSRHHWVYKFDFTSGFYMVHILILMQPFLAFYTEGRGFLTQN